MKNTPIRRCAAVAGAAIFIATGTPTTTMASATVRQFGTESRPCFTVRAQWNTALDGPQPTCPVPTWQVRTSARVAPAAVGWPTLTESPADLHVRRMDFMP